ncbi:MAG TPA: hypothetical protein VFB81_02865 [Myxococcales bacterium]|nr:hypothetical protein [Myxococcales bacterium]
MAESDYVDACEYEYLSASGAAFDNCLLLGYRTLAGFPFSPFEMESWVIHYKDEQLPDGTYRITYEYGDARWLTGLWRSLAGPVYVSDAEGLVRICRDYNKPGPEAWEIVKLDSQLFGIWGLSDSNVWTWGRADKDDRMFRYDGKAWTPMPSPGHVSTVHGLAPDLLYAVGYDGLMARWDGQKWTPISVEVDSNFTGLFVAGPDELYATTEAGELWEGTSHGWSKRATGPGALLDVAKYRDEIWVAAGEEGLLKLKGRTNELECIKPNVHAKSFDVRGNLVITTKELIVGSADGVKFTGRGRDLLRKFREPHRPMWLA